MKTRKPARDLVVDTARALGMDARRLTEEGLAALALTLEPARSSTLRSMAVRQAADALVAEREVAQILGSLTDLVIAPWKGVALAPIWRTHSSVVQRPVGDLDLLVDPDDLARAVATLVALGYERAPEDRGGVFRRAPTGVELLPPAGRIVAVDLHARPFRSVGHRILVRELLARSTPGTVLGQPVRMLDPIDHLHLCLVHAAKHAACRAKWRIDVRLLTHDLSSDSLAILRERSRVARTERPCALVLGTVLGTSPLAVDRAYRRFRPLLEAVVQRAWSNPTLPKMDRYALEWLLEPSVRARATMLVGMVESRARDFKIARASG